MITDSWPVAPQGDIETDICVIGAGPAGISFAREFIGSPVRVCVLESGGYEADARAQDLGRGTAESSHHGADALSEGRQRQFGGTTNKWLFHTRPGNGRRYARSLPPQPIDFEEAPCRSGFGWPFAIKTLLPFYERGQVVWNGGPFEYDAGKWAGPSAAPLVFSGGDISTEISQHGPADVFFLRYRDELLASENITVHVGCTVVKLEADGARTSIKRVRVARSDGTTFAITARQFVLAGGGVENVQLLLLSEIARPGGPANQHDNVGRYLSDHPEFRMGTITPARREAFEKIALYDIRWVGRQMVSGFLTIKEEAKRNMGLLNMSLAMVPRSAGFGTAAHQAMASLRAMRRDGMSSDVISHLGSVAGALGDVSDVWRTRGQGFQEFSGGWSRPDVDQKQFHTIELWAASEQTPDRENRLILTDDRDWLGRKKARLHWRWSQTDQDNIKRSVAILAAGLEDAGLGRYTQWVEFDGPGRPHYEGIHHPMGGTRMHPDPRFGVVDADCRVHGTDNLYAAGSSVFSNGHGYANPTLTILALSLRLADHVKTRVGAAVRSA